MPVGALHGEIVFREMELEDVDPVFEIDRVSFSLPWSKRAFRLEITDNPASTMLVAELRDGKFRQIVGYIGFWHIVDEIHISTLAVKPAFRRIGIGERLLLEALAKALEMGAETATLEVRESNTPAIRLYEKHHFEVERRKPGYYHDNNEDALQMILRRPISMLINQSGGKY
jgi:ribosomal-protein-alanine N-acetyltransferase